MKGGICGIVVNEIEAFTTENETEIEIANIIKQEVCSIFGGSLEAVCENLVQELPNIVSGT
jgi:hypothetical protein